MHTTTSTPTARKKHTCEVCGWAINPGDKYDRTVTFDGGDVLVWKSHLDPCSIAAESAVNDSYDDLDGVVTADSVIEWAAEAARHDPFGHPEAVELKRRLTINEERWREQSAKGLEGDDDA